MPPKAAGDILGVDGLRMVAPKGGNGESIPEDIMTAGCRGGGAVALLVGGLPDGDLDRPELGVIGDGLR